MKTKPWYDVLLAARRVGKRGDPLTSSSLALESGLEINIASAWLFKFEKFGYVLRSEKVVTGKRWSWAWGLTRWGIEMGLRRKASATKQMHLRVAANPTGKKD